MEFFAVIGLVTVCMLLACLVAWLITDLTKGCPKSDTQQRLDDIHQIGREARQEIEDLSALFRVDALTMLANETLKEKIDATKKD